jgi:hypothetical protein
MRLWKKQSDASESKGEISKRRRREGRGLGPFSGGQLTIIIVTFAVLLLFPIGAWALTFSNVAITDPGGVNQANVDAQHNLDTATRDAVSGVAAKVNSLGQQLAAVTGSVTATPTPLSASFDNETPVGQPSPCTSLTPTVPAGKALVVTSVTVAVSFVTTGPVVVSLVAATPGSPCNGLSNADISEVSGRGETEFIPFPQGYPIKAGHVLGLNVSSGSGDASMFVTVKGYWVSTTCTVSGPPTGCN